MQVDVTECRLGLGCGLRSGAWHCGQSHCIGGPMPNADSRSGRDGVMCCQHWAKVEGLCASEPPQSVSSLPHTCTYVQCVRRFWLRL